MEVTELGMVMEVKLSQLENALFPIEVTELGMVMEVKLSHSENA
jgi:metal-sulfur cluster biosynthetic enzyme